MKVAVVAHTGKTLGGGLVELRHLLERAGVPDPLWYEVDKAKQAPKKARKALDRGAGLVLAWGGDGLVRRCLGELAGSGVPLGILPAGTANLLAANLGVPGELEEAVDVALAGHTRTLDLGRLGDERFAVMAGVGFDAEMIRDADDLKPRLGRMAYLVSGAKHLPPDPFEARIRVDGTHWFAGRAGCVLLGNVGKMFGGLEAFPDARPDDGLLEVGVVTAEGVTQWARTIARTAVGHPERSRFVQTTRGRTVTVELDHAVRYELDGGERGKVQDFEVVIERGAVSVCTPRVAELREDGMSSQPAPLRLARREGEEVVRKPPFEWLARAGLVARGVIYAIIAILAVKVALSAGGRTTDQQGALKEIAGAPFGKVLLVLMVIGLAGYAVWRLLRAALGHGPEQHDDTKDRIGGLFSGVAYAVLCVAAVSILLHAGSSSGSPKETTGGVLEWTGGPWLVGIAGVVMAVVAFDQAYKGLSRKFLEQSKTEQMSHGGRQGFTAIGVFGHLARAVVFGLVAYGLLKAAITFDADEAVGLDGALAQLAHASYGPVLLGAVAFGLLGFALYSVLDARYRRV